MLKAHMSILHNQCAMLDNGRVQIIGAPFWYQVAHGDEYAVAQRLSDYRYIKVKRGNRYAKLLYRDVLAAHYQSVCFIEETLRASPSGVQNILFTDHPTSRLFGDADLGYGTALPYGGQRMRKSGYLKSLQPASTATPTNTCPCVTPTNTAFRR